MYLSCDSIIIYVYLMWWLWMMIYAYSPVCRISRSLPTGQLPYTVHATKFRLVLEVFVKRMEQYQHGCATVSVLDTWTELVQYVHYVLVHATQRQPWLQTNNKHCDSAADSGFIWGDRFSSATHLLLLVAINVSLYCLSLNHDCFCGRTLTAVFMKCC